MRRDAAFVGYEEFDPAWAGGASPVRVVRYAYWKTGDVANIVIKDEGVAPPEDADRYNWYRSLACYYTTSGQLWQVLWDRWLLDGEGNVNVHQKLAAREFRYDTPRARYMSRAVDPETWQPFEPADPNAAISHGEWTDYLGDQPWGDFSVSTPRVAGEPQPPVTGAVRRYLPGFGMQAVETSATSGPNRVTYFHGDLIRSNWATSETGEVAETTTAYTAFGENLGGTPGGPGGLDPETRYGFAGGWGYESGLLTLDGAPGTPPITLQHLGARWYQPEIGRFVQRDPAGLGGGTNVYGYAHNSPNISVDPKGRWIFVVILAVVVAGMLVSEGCDCVENVGNALMFPAVANNPTPDPTANPDSGRDPRNDGRLADCIPILELAIQATTDLPPFVNPGVPVWSRPQPTPPFVGSRPESGWNWPRADEENVP